MTELKGIQGVYFTLMKDILNRKHRVIVISVTLVILHFSEICTILDFQESFILGSVKRIVVDVLNEVFPNFTMAKIIF